MGLTRQFIIGMLFGLCLAACAGATFPYHEYGVDIPDSLLRGPTTQDDLSLTVCLPNATSQSPCVAMLTDVFEALKTDYIDTKDQLIACQHQLAEK